MELTSDEVITKPFSAIRGKEKYKYEISIFIIDQNSTDICPSNGKMGHTSNRTLSELI